MRQQRWLRVIPVALIMYTISYVDRTNVSLAFDRQISSLMSDLLMDDRMKGEAAGIFFLGYILLQIPGGYWATRWSARKLISLFLISWGLCAVGCGLSRSFRQFELMRFMLGVAESGVFPATLVLLANWFPQGERARANACWTLCQPLAIVASAPLTSWLLGAYGWQRTLVLEGMLPFLWLPLWWFCIRDHPREAAWISTAERQFLETTLQRERQALELGTASGSWRELCRPLVVVMVVMYFLQNCAAYGCMTFFTATLEGRTLGGQTYGLLFALPYAVTAVVMVANSWHSDRTGERRSHVAFAYLVSGCALILGVSLKEHFWLSYALLCLAIPGPFAAMGPFWSLPAENLPRRLTGPAVGLINAFGNLGGFAGPYIAGWLKQVHGDVVMAFAVLGSGLLLAAALAALLPSRFRR